MNADKLGFSAQKRQARGKSSGEMSSTLDVFRLLGRASVSGTDVCVLEDRRFCDFPCEGVLPATSTDDQDAESHDKMMKIFSCIRIRLHIGHYRRSLADRSPEACLRLRHIAGLWLHVHTSSPISTQGLSECRKTRWKHALCGVDTIYRADKRSQGVQLIKQSAGVLQEQFYMRSM